MKDLRYENIRAVKCGKGCKRKIWGIIFIEPLSFSISPKNKEKEEYDAYAVYQDGTA